MFFSKCIYFKKTPVIHKKLLLLITSSTTLANCQKSLKRIPIIDIKRIEKRS